MPGLLTVTGHLPGHLLLSSAGRSYNLHVWLPLGEGGGKAAASIHFAATERRIKYGNIVPTFHTDPSSLYQASINLFIWILF